MLSDLSSIPIRNSNSHNRSNLNSRRQRLPIPLRVSISLTHRLRSYGLCRSGDANDDRSIACRGFSTSTATGPCFIIRFPSLRADNAIRCFSSRIGRTEIDSGRFTCWTRRTISNPMQFNQAFSDGRSRPRQIRKNGQDNNGGNADLYRCRNSTVSPARCLSQRTVGNDRG